MVKHCPLILSTKTATPDPEASINQLESLHLKSSVNPIGSAGVVYHRTSHLWPGRWSHLACGLLPQGYGGVHLDSSPLQNLFFSQSSHAGVEAISDPILPNLGRSSLLSLLASQQL